MNLHCDGVTLFGELFGSPQAARTESVSVRSMRKAIANPVCPQTGNLMHRATRPMTLAYKGRSITFEMSGWYCEACKESIHSGADMKISDRMMNLLKARNGGLPTPRD